MMLHGGGGRCLFKRAPVLAIIITGPSVPCAGVPMSRSRSWQFTVNNYIDSDLTRLAQVECVYIVYGKEVAPTTGTPHL